jgi:hypothetical protein
MEIPARTGTGDGNLSGEIRVAARRQFLTELAALGASALIPGSGLLAQATAD